MKAKRVYEALNDILAPKAKDDIYSSLRDSLESFDVNESKNWFLLVFGPEDQKELKRFALNFFPGFGALNSNGSMMDVSSYMTNGKKFFALLNKFDKNIYVGLIQNGKASEVVGDSNYYINSSKINTILQDEFPEFNENY